MTGRAPDTVRIAALEARIDELETKNEKLARALRRCKREVGENGNPWENIAGIVDTALRGNT